jgi:uncharacterized membrane-anchored protein
MRAWIVAATLALACAGANAQNNAARAEFQTALEAAHKVAVGGPAEVKLVDQGLLKLPAGYTYFPGPESVRLLTAMGNRPGTDLLGMVIPQAKDADWFVVMRFVKSGYIKDDDAREWKVDELLANLKDGTEEANKERRTRGISEVEIVGWLEAPKYDAGTHRLVWSLESRDKGAPASAERGVNYNTYALGREGYVSMNLVTGMATIHKEKPHAQALLAALEYHDGKRYGDFNSATDHVAEYGLAALVGGIAAKKLGLFALLFAFLAKFAKVIGVAVIALGALAAKFFKKKT